MLFGASEFLAMFDLRRFLAITGWKGAGKDLLTQEIVQYYLKRKSRKTGNFYKLVSNQVCVWNDDLYDENGEVQNLMGTVFWITEAGMYIRKMSEFRNPYSLARKFDNFFVFPSIELPHAVLTSFVVEPVFKWQMIFGLWFNPVWSWTVEGGHSRSYGGTFVWLPNKAELGIYDTDDPSENTDEIFEAYAKVVDREQKRRSRVGISAMASSEDEQIDASALGQIASVYREIALSIQDGANKTHKK